jgi:molybdate/tungstate transport system substrate-binding protein
MHWRYDGESAEGEESTEVGGTRRWRLLELKPAVLCALCLLCALLLSCKKAPTEIVVFYASSLSAVLGDLSEAFRKANPGFRVRLEPSGSQVAVRKVVDMGMRADIVAVADAALIDKMMIPSHATWNIAFATNEIVIAHKDHSKWTDQITAQNWPEVLVREGVRLGRADPDTSPIGYQTVMVWQLAESSGAYGSSAAQLAGRLMAQCSKDHVVHDEAELLALLESRAIDYAFLFRSTAEDHHLKILSLPPEINLSRQEQAARYAAAKVEIRMKQGQGSTHIVGAPVTYGLVIPARAPHAEAAARLTAFVLGDAGRRLIERRGFRPISPAQCSPCAGIPASILPLVTSTASPSPSPAP